MKRGEGFGFEFVLEYVEVVENGGGLTKLSMRLWMLRGC